MCLGTLLAACGSGSPDDGYVAVGAAGAGPDRRGETVAPSGDVVMVPLDGSGDGKSGSGKDGKGGAGGKGSAKGGDGSGSAASGGSGSGSSGGGGSSQEPGGSGSSGGSGGSGSSSGGSSGGTSGGSGTPSPPGTTAPAGPALLEFDKPKREPAEDRWCEKVTLELHNTGGAPVRSGTVTFGTHIIGALGVDWATIESTEKLPAPIGAGETKKKTWTVCVEAWRVPLGMHVETQDVSVKWK